MRVSAEIFINYLDVLLVYALYIDKFASSCTRFIHLGIFLEFHSSKQNKGAVCRERKLYTEMTFATLKISKDIVFKLKP